MKVTLLPGDGIGAEVLEAAMRVAEAVASKYGVSFATTEELIGGASLDAKGVPVTDEALQTCLDSDVTLLGAVGGPKWESVEHRLKPEAALLKLRKTLELFSNVRPAKVYAPLLGESSLKAERLDGADFVVMRELTGGIYFGEPRGLGDTRGFNTMVYETAEVERIARKAFEIARLRGKKVVSVDKANVPRVLAGLEKLGDHASPRRPTLMVSSFRVLYSGQRGDADRPRLRLSIRRQPDRSRLSCS